MGEPFVRKNRAIVHNTIGTPIASKTMPTGNLTGTGIESRKSQVLSNQGAKTIITTTAPYQNNAPATDQRNLLLSRFAATR